MENGADCGTIIGNDVVIKGEITVEKGLRVDGRIEGTVTTKGTVHVGETGQLAAEVKGCTVLIEGQVKGNISASDRVTLKATSNVNGDLTANKLIVNDGARFSGNLNIGPGVVKSYTIEAQATTEVPAPVASRVSNQFSRPVRR